MAFAKGMSEKCKQAGEINGALICGLPDDVALLCLAMVPRQYHQILRCVSRRWKTLVGSEEWRSCRRENNLEETWIYALCRGGSRGNSRGNCYYVFDPHPTRRSWEPLHAVPPQCLKNEGMCFEALGEKLYLMGGCSWQEDALDEVYCYDACANKWVMGAPLPTARCYFSSAALDKKLYVAGGYGTVSTSVKSWDIFDLDSNSWSSQTDPTVFSSSPDIYKLVPLDDKIFTIHKVLNRMRHAGVYDTTSGMWQGFDHEISECHHGPTVVVDGTLYMLEETIGTRLMMWRKESEDWVALGRLAHRFTSPPCQAVSIGRRIFLIGQGLNTMFIDVDKVAPHGGMVMSSTLVGRELNPYLTVISCKTITI